MRKIFVAAAMFALTLGPSISGGADWEYFMQDDKGDSYYMNLESIKHTSKGTVKLQRKVEPQKPSTYTSRVSEIEMDCKNNKLKINKETTYSTNGKSKILQGDSGWKPVNAEGLDELLLELVCSLKKAG